MSIENAMEFVGKIKNDQNLQGELFKLVGGLLGGSGGGQGGGLNISALLGGLGAIGGTGGNNAGGDLLQIVVEFAKKKGFSFVKDELQKTLGGVDISSLLAQFGGGGGTSGGIDVGKLFKQ